MQDNIDPNKNYERISNGDVFTGKQIINLLELSKDSSALKAIILLDIHETDKPAMKPKSQYGL